MNQDAFDMMVYSTLHTVDALYEGAGFDNYQQADVLIHDLSEASRRLSQIVESIKAAQSLGV